MRLAGSEVGFTLVLNSIRIIKDERLFFVVKEDETERRTTKNFFNQRVLYNKVFYLNVGSTFLK